MRVARRLVTSTSSPSTTPVPPGGPCPSVRNCTTRTTRATSRPTASAPRETSAFFMTRSRSARSLPPSSAWLFPLARTNARPRPGCRWRFALGAPAWTSIEARIDHVLAQSLRVRIPPGPGVSGNARMVSGVIWVVKSPTASAGCSRIRNGRPLRCWIARTFSRTNLWKETSIGLRRSRFELGPPSRARRCAMEGSRRDVRGWAPSEAGPEGNSAPPTNGERCTSRPKELGRFWTCWPSPRRRMSVPSCWDSSVSR